MSPGFVVDSPRRLSLACGLTSTFDAPVEFPALLGRKLLEGFDGSGEHADAGNVVTLGQLGARNNCGRRHTGHYARITHRYHLIANDMKPPTEYKQNPPLKISSDSTLAVSDIATRVISSAYMAQAKTKNFLVRLPPPLKERWDATCDARQVDLNTAAMNLIEWWVDLPPLLQAMVIDSQPAEPELVEMMLRQLIERDRERSGKRLRTPKVGTFKKERSVD